MLGQQANTLDFPSILAEKKILLVNLARQNVISEDNQHLLGTLLVNELLSAGFARRPHERQPFFVFIDEFSHFVTKDACEMPYEASSFNGFTRMGNLSRFGRAMRLPRAMVTKSGTRIRW